MHSKTCCVSCYSPFIHHWRDFMSRYQAPPFQLTNFTSFLHFQKHFLWPHFYVAILVSAKVILNVFVFLKWSSLLLRWSCGDIHDPKKFKLKSWFHIMGFENHGNNSKEKIRELSRWYSQMEYSNLSESFFNFQLWKKQLATTKVYIYIYIVTQIKLVGWLVGWLEIFKKNS